MLRRIWAIIQKEFVQTFRDRSTLLIQLSVPFVLLLLFGYAISMNVEDIPVVVADQSHDAESRAVVDALVVSGYFDMIDYVQGEADVIRAIDEGRAGMGIVIPAGLSAHVEQGDGQLLILVDGSELFASQSAYNAATIVAEAHSAELLISKVKEAGQLPKGQSLMPLDVRVRILYNPNLEEIWFLIPSLVAMLLQIQSMSLTAASVVREREMGTIEQIPVTPIRSGELMLGKMAPHVIIALVNIVTIVAVGILWFGVPFRGSGTLFLVLACLYIFAGLGSSDLDHISEPKTSPADNPHCHAAGGGAWGLYLPTVRYALFDPGHRLSVSTYLLYPDLAGDHHQGGRALFSVGGRSGTGRLCTRGHSAGVGNLQEALGLVGT